MTLLVTGLNFTSAPALDVADGLLGWVRFAIYGEFEIDGVVVRRTRDGRITLKYPSRADRGGSRRYVVRPLSEDVRLAVEGQVLEALREQRRLAS